MAAISVARVGAPSRSAASIDEMVMQRPERAAPAQRTSLLPRRFGGLAWNLARALRLAQPASVRLSIVEFGCLLRRLEDLRIVSVENLRVVGVAHQPNALIAAIGVARILCARDRRDQILVEVLLEIDNVACEDHRAGLG